MTAELQRQMITGIIATSEWHSQKSHDRVVMKETKREPSRFTARGLFSTNNSVIMFVIVVSRYDVYPSMKEMKRLILAG